MPSLCVGLNKQFCFGLTVNLAGQEVFVVIYFCPKALLYSYLVGNIGGCCEHSFGRMANWGGGICIFLFWDDYRMLYVFNVARTKLSLRVKRQNESLS